MREVHRVGKTILLSSAGYHFLPHAKEILEKYEQGLGVSYLPRTMVQKELRVGRISEITMKKVLPLKSFTYVVTYVVTKVATHEVKAFRIFLKMAIAKY